MLTFAKRIRRNFQRCRITLYRRCVLAFMVLNRNSNVARVLVIRVMKSVPTRFRLTVNENEYTSMRQRKFIRPNLMYLMILFSFTIRLIHSRVVLTFNSTFVRKVERFPRVLFHGTTMVLRRKISTVNVRMLMFILCYLIRHDSRQLNLRTTTGRRVTPMITSTILPTFTIKALFSLVFLTRRRTIIIPIRRMGHVQVHEAVRMRVTTLHVSVTNRRLRYRPMYRVFNVRVFTRGITRQR